MGKKYVLAVIALLTITLCNSGISAVPNRCYDDAASKTPNSEIRIDLSSENVIVSDSGLFMLVPNPDSGLDKVAITDLSMDELGLFTSLASVEIDRPPLLIRCPNNHVATCSKCFGCSSKNCNYRCKCR